MEEHELLSRGFRFYPTEEELVTFYLHNKLEGKRQEMHRVIPVVDIHQREPWDLPRLAGELCQGDTEQWFFFRARHEREARGGRPVRTTASGYWKATGSPGYVYSSDNRVVGVKKTMVFYTGKAPTGSKTKWKMHEYRAIQQVPDSTTTTIPKLRHEFSLCRVYVVSGSSSAFDRRPQEVAHREAQPTGDIPTTFAQVPRMAEPTTSPETSHSCGGHDYSPRNGDSATWEMVTGPEPPLWGWEQLYWP